ncbi:Pre-mRNA-splicing factor CWC22-like protein, partial [Ophiophagus hannah]
MGARLFRFQATALIFSEESQRIRREAGGSIRPPRAINIFGKNSILLLIKYTFFTAFKKKKRLYFSKTSPQMFAGSCQGDDSDAANSRLAVEKLGGETKVAGNAGCPGPPSVAGLKDGRKGRWKEGRKWGRKNEGGKKREKGRKENGEGRRKGRTKEGDWNKRKEGRKRKEENGERRRERGRKEDRKRKEGNGERRRKEEGRKEDRKRKEMRKEEGKEGRKGIGIKGRKEGRKREEDRKMKEGNAEEGSKQALVVGESWELKSTHFQAAKVETPWFMVQSSLCKPTEWLNSVLQLSMCCLIRDGFLLVLSSSAELVALKSSRHRIGSIAAQLSRHQADDDLQAPAQHAGKHILTLSDPTPVSDGGFVQFSGSTGLVRDASQ